MLIIYRGETVRVEVITYDESDPDMPYLVWFPEGHEMHDENGVWLSAKDLVILEP